MDRQKALQQIDSIYQTMMQDGFKATISGLYIVAVGCAIVAIPFLEKILSMTIDPLLIKVSGQWAFPVIFIVRTIFYWTLFVVIAQCFDSHKKAKMDMHPVLKKIWSLGKVFPIIPIATAAVLAQCGYANLILPIILILMGCLLMVFGLFSPWVVTIIAWGYIIGGLISIYLSTLSIHDLWIYLLIYQGVGYILMGLLLYAEQRIASSQEA